MLVRKIGPALLVAMALGAGVTAPLAADAPACGSRDTPNLIYPGDPRWALDKNVYPAAVNFADAAITGTNPRSGNGSLELTTTGSLFDWAFFKRVADGDAAWGLLSAVNCVSFDWWRNSYVLPDPAPANLTAETWQEQTPVLRLLVRDQGVVSHLVWEQWYNTRNTGIVPTANDVWNFENITGQQLWRHFDGGLTYTNAGCNNTNFTGSDALQTYDIGGWMTNCYSSSAEIFGIMIGVGSMWPGNYHAFLDNVQLGFAGQGFAVEDNFELPTTSTPEPASMVLLGSGLLGLTVAGYFQRRRRSHSA